METGTRCSSKFKRKDRCDLKDLLFFTGLLIIGASAGACDVGNITLAQAVKQSLVGLPIMALGIRWGEVSGNR